MTVVSKYQKARYALLLPLVILFDCVLFLLIGAYIRNGFMHNPFWVSFLLLCMAVIFGWLTVQTFKLYSRKEIDGNKLKFYMPYLPFLVFSRDLNDYDAKFRVKTYDRYEELIDGLWLIKHGKVKYEMYSDAFSNLNELANAIKLPEHIMEEPVSSSTLTKYQLGLKRVKTPFQKN